MEEAKPQKKKENILYSIIFILFCTAIFIPFLYSGIKDIIEERYGYGIAFLSMAAVFLGLTISSVIDMLVKIKKGKAAQIQEEIAVTFKDDVI
ncbi:MAG: hypothetical protein ACFFDW_04685 [Candidatus Thorarchaeota archaeon]